MQTSLSKQRPHCTTIINVNASNQSLFGSEGEMAANLRQPLTITSAQSGYSKASRIAATPDYKKTLLAAADYRFKSLCHLVLLVY